MTGSNQCCFITNIGDVGTRKARCLACKEVDIKAVIHLQRTQMDFENGLTFSQIRQIYVDLTVETTCTKQGFVEHICTVCGCQNNDSTVCSETIHLCQ